MWKRKFSRRITLAQACVEAVGTDPAVQLQCTLFLLCEDVWSTLAETELQEGSHFSRTHCKQVLATSQWNSTQPRQKNYWSQETPCIRDEKGSKGQSILRKSWYILIGCGKAWNPLARRQCLTGKCGVPLDSKHAPEQHLLRHLWLHVATPCDAFSCTIRTNIDTHLLDRLYPTELLCGVCVNLKVI